MPIFVINFKPNLSFFAKNSHNKLKTSKKYLIKDETPISTPLEMDGDKNFNSVSKLIESKSVQWIDKAGKDDESKHSESYFNCDEL